MYGRFKLESLWALCWPQNKQLNCMIFPNWHQAVHYLIYCICYAVCTWWKFITQTLTGDHCCFTPLIALYCLAQYITDLLINHSTVLSDPSITGSGPRVENQNTMLSTNGIFSEMLSDRIDWLWNTNNKRDIQGWFIKLFQTCMNIFLLLIF